jgi:zinc protease
MKLWLFLISALLSLVAAVNAQTPIRQMEGVTEYRLPNGLQILLAPNDLQPRTYVNLVVKAGSAVEGFGEGGMAHLLEHMLFKGTPTTSDPMRAFVERSLNAGGTTTLDRTNYSASMSPSPENLQWYFGWLADAMFNSSIRKVDLDKEMTVVRNEFERLKSDVGNVMAEQRMALAFPRHGYGRPVYGNQSDIENISIDKLQAFYKTWYRIDNMALVVTGRFDVAHTLRQITEAFGRVEKSTSAIPQTYTREAVQTGIRGSTIRQPGGQVMTLIGWRGAPYAHPDDAALIAVAHALSNSTGGRFKLAAISKNLTGESVVALHLAHAQYGSFSVFAQVKESQKLDETQALLLKHIDDIATSGVTQEELLRAKTQVRALFETYKNNADSFGSLLAEAVAAGDWRLTFWQRQNITDLTLEQVQSAAKRYLVNANRVRVSYIPEAQSERAPDAAPQDLDDFVVQDTAHSKPRSSSNLERFEPTGIELDKRIVRSELKVGTKLALLERPAAGDAIHGRLNIHWGSAKTMTQYRYAAMMGELIVYGVQGQGSKQLIDALDAIQSGVTVNSNTQGLFVTFKTTRQQWRAFAQLFEKILGEPTLAEASFMGWKRAKIQNLQAQKDDPRSQAFKALWRAQYSYDKVDIRYTPTYAEELAGWQALSFADVKRFWTEFAGASVSEFSAVGAMDAAEIQRDMTRVLEGWDTQGGATAYERIAYSLPTITAQRLIVPTPGKPNALLLWSKRLPAQGYSREWQAMFWASNMIGRRGNSRLYNRLRKEEGLTYDTFTASSGFEDDSTIAFTIEGTFAPQNLERYEAVLRETLDEIQRHGFTEEELATEKKMHAQQILTGRENDANLAFNLALNEKRMRDGKRSDYLYWDDMLLMVQTLSLAELNAAAAKLVDTQQAVTVIAGDFKP